MATTLEDFARLLGVPSEDEHIELRRRRATSSWTLPRIIASLWPTRVVGG